VISPSQRPLPTQGNTTYRHNRQTSMLRAGFEPATPATKRPQTYALDRPLGSALFIIYMNKIIQKWKVIRHGNIPINRNVNIDTMLFADDQVLLAKSEDDLQYSVHNLNKVASEFSMDINTDTTRVMAFRLMVPIRSKICINKMRH
jgi:hypothetical protein